MKDVASIMTCVEEVNGMTTVGNILPPILKSVNALLIPSASFEAVSSPCVYPNPPSVLTKSPATLLGIHKQESYLNPMHLD